MLISLHVKNLAIIDEIQVDFKENLNILTGETGAGKSIILGSINIALGGRVPSEMLRPDAEYALVELVFDIQGNEAVREVMNQQEIPMFDDQVILARRMMGGRSISRINGETVNLATLREVAAVLIDIHGQHEHQSLLHIAKHLETLDRYCHNESEPLLEEISHTYSEYCAVQKELSEAGMSPEERNREIAFQMFEKDEIEKAALKEGEEEELEATYRRYANAERIMNGMESIHDTMSASSNSVSEQIDYALGQMNQIQNYDDELTGFGEQLSQIESLLNDFNRDVAGYLSEYSFDEEEFTQTEARLNEVRRILAKYGSSVSEVITYYEKVCTRLAQLEQYEEYCKERTSYLQQTEEKLRLLCEQLSGVRKAAAINLRTQLIKALQELNFNQVQFDIQIDSLEAYSPNGMDRVEFLISTNPGQPLQSLGKIASGGELSRVMLAIKSILAANDEIDTLIFDEIDVGISGRTAQKVSERLAVIARHHQVICITHLAQLAAMADSHYVIEKEVAAGKTSTKIHYLEEQSSILELARILGGAQITDAVLLNAGEMKALAEEYKKSIS